MSRADHWTPGSPQTGSLAARRVAGAKRSAAAFWAAALDFGLSCAGATDEDRIALAVEEGVGGELQSAKPLNLLSTKSGEGQSYRIGRLRRVSPYIVTAEHIAFVGLDAPQCDGICLIEDDASETLANDLGVRKCL